MYEQKKIRKIRKFRTRRLLDNNAPNIVKVVPKHTKRSENQSSVGKSRSSPDDEASPSRRRLGQVLQWQRVETVEIVVEVVPVSRAPVKRGFRPKHYHGPLPYTHGHV